MKKLALSLSLVVLAAGCSLRPRYNDFHLLVDVVKDARFVVVNPATNQPIAGAKVEMGEGKYRVNVTSDANGVFTLPVDKRYVAENPVLVVNLPAGFTTYEVRLAPAPPPELPPEAPAAEPVDAGTLDEADAGTPALAAPVQATY